ncbi:MAG: DUF6252 family protein [Bacteroidales bacterium]|nr:DUF6252 family protein [Bacteroidales bacterium]
MKSFVNPSLLLGLLFTIFFSACSKNDNNTKVGVDEGYVSVSIGDSATLYKIEEISYMVSNDTTTLELIALKANSSNDYIVIGLHKISKLGEKEYVITNQFETEPDSSSTYLYYMTGNNSQLQVIEEGKLKVLKYQYNNTFQANFSYVIYQNNDTLPVNGEVNLNFAKFDPSRIPNVPIQPGKMRIKTDSMQITISCVASYISASNQYVINGVDNGISLVVEINGIEPKINKTYPIGQTIDSTGFIKLTYTNPDGTYICDGKNSTHGQLTIAKITYNSLQGYVEGNAYQSKNKKVITFSNGVFFARLKRINN